MAYGYEENALENPHRLTLDSRSRLTLTGVTEVESFDEEKIILITHEGYLTVSGNGMRIKKLSSENGDAVVEGQINGCVYTDGKKEKESFLKRVLK